MFEQSLSKEDWNSVSIVALLCSDSARRESQNKSSSALRSTVLVSYLDGVGDGEVGRKLQWGDL